MKTSVVWSEQVESFVMACSPEPKRSLRLAIRGLADDRGDTKPLTDALQGYFRLRVGPYRVIYREEFTSGQRVLKCLFAERRNVIYELFSAMVLDNLT